MAPRSASAKASIMWSDSVSAGNPVPSIPCASPLSPNASCLVVVEVLDLGDSTVELGADGGD